MEYIKSIRGGDKLVYEGHIYVKQKDLANGVVSFECEEGRNKAACKAKVKVDSRKNTVVGRLHDHTHAPDATKTEAAKTVQKMKMKAVSTEETAQQIISEACSQVTEEVGAKLAPLHHIRRNIRRQRQQTSHSRPLPLSAQELILTDVHTRTLDDQEFLLYDSGTFDKRILMFGTHKNLNFLGEASHWFLDGTFKTVPRIFFTTVYSACLNQCSFSAISLRSFDGQKPSNIYYCA